MKFLILLFLTTQAMASTTLDLILKAQGTALEAMEEQSAQKLSG